MNEDEFILEDSILNFLLYYNNRVHATTRYSPYDIMEKRSDKNNEESKREYIKIKKGYRDRRIKKDQIVLISNKLIQPDKQNHYLNYHKPIILKKGEQKEHFKVKRKVIEKKRDYCKVIIMSKQDNKHIFQKGEI